MLYTDRIGLDLVGCDIFELGSDRKKSNISRIYNMCAFTFRLNPMRSEIYLPLSDRIQSDIRNRTDWSVYRTRSERFHQRTTIYFIFSSSYVGWYEVTQCLRGKKGVNNSKTENDSVFSDRGLTIEDIVATRLRVTLDKELNPKLSPNHGSFYLRIGAVGMYIHFIYRAF